MNRLDTPGGQQPRLSAVASPWAAWTAAGMVILIAALSTVTWGRQPILVPAAHRQQVAEGPGADTNVPGQPGVAQPGSNGNSGGSGSGSSGGGSATTANTGGGSQQKQNPSTFKCARGQNGGNTDTGVTGNEIRLASTVVKHGVGQAFLGDVEFGMEAYLNKINSSGGVCGRQLSIKLSDDGWDASTGQQDIRAFIDEGYFALAVEPSSEGLRGALNAGDVDRAAIPVVGTDGMLQDQYIDPWVWPVSTSTNSLMHILTKYAYDKGARTFGIIYDQNYRFGVEGKAAFEGAVHRLGGQVVNETPVTAGNTDYKNEVNQFNGACGSCDFVALLLEPDTATTVIHDGVYLGTSGKAIGAAGPQTLFTYSFANNFAQNCDPDTSCKTHFLVWTGFKPAIPPYDTDSAVNTFVNDLGATNSSADHYNQFVEGGYDGMELMVKALQKLGPDVTRAGLRQVLDSMSYDSGLSAPETFSPGHHFANVSAQAFSLVLNGQSFVAFRYEQTGFLADPWVGKDLAAGQ